MDSGHIKKLNSFHVVFLVQNVMVGVNLLTLPHSLSVTGYNQWWVVLIIGAIAQITLIPIFLLAIRYPDQNLYAINERLLGKWLGKLCNMVIIAYAIICTSAVTEVYIRLVQTVTLPEQTLPLPLFLLVLVVVYISSGGIKSIARFCVFSFFAASWLVYYLQWGYQKGSIEHIFPLFNITLPDLMEGIRKSWSAMLGYELLMIYFPYIQNQRKALRDASLGMWISVLIYSAVCFTSVIYFSPWQLEHLLYPVLNLFKAVELSFLERIENFGIAIWIFLILTTASAFLWTAKRGLDSLFSKSRAIYLYLIGGFVAIPWRGIIPLKLQVFIYDNMFVYLGCGLILWPNLLLIIHAIKKRWEGAKS